MDRCHHCNSKLKIVNFTCECDNNFCIKCRLPESHKCTFDRSDKKILEVVLPKIICNKITKI